MAKNLTQILAERPDIGKMVYEKYPEDQKEFECANEKREMDALRWKMAKRVLDGTWEQHKKEYGDKVTLLNALKQFNEENKINNK